MISNAILFELEKLIATQIREQDIAAEYRMTEIKQYVHKQRPNLKEALEALVTGMAILTTQQLLNTPTCPKLKPPVDEAAAARNWLRRRVGGMCQRAMVFTSHEKLKSGKRYKLMSYGFKPTGFKRLQEEFNSHWPQFKLTMYQGPQDGAAIRGVIMHESISPE